MGSVIRRQKSLPLTVSTKGHEVSGGESNYVFVVSDLVFNGFYYWNSKRFTYLKFTINNSYSIDCAKV